MPSWYPLSFPCGSFVNLETWGLHYCFDLTMRTVFMGSFLKRIERKFNYQSGKWTALRAVMHAPNYKCSCVLQPQTLVHLTFCTWKSVSFEWDKLFLIFSDSNGFSVRSSVRKENKFLRKIATVTSSIYKKGTAATSPQLFSFLRYIFIRLDLF